MPALPLDEAGKYVAAAYLVFLALILIYVAIMAVRLSRIEREIAELNRATAGLGPRPEQPLAEVSSAPEPQPELVEREAAPR